MPAVEFTNIGHVSAETTARPCFGVWGGITLDELVFYKRCLSDTEIRDLVKVRGGDPAFDVLEEPSSAHKPAPSFPGDGDAKASRTKKPDVPTDHRRKP